MEENSIQKEWEELPQFTETKTQHSDGTFSGCAGCCGVTNKDGSTTLLRFNNDVPVSEEEFINTKRSERINSILDEQI